MSTHKQLKECVCPRTGRVIRIGDVEPIPPEIDMQVARNATRARATRKERDEKAARIRARKQDPSAS